MASALLGPSLIWPRTTRRKGQARAVGEVTQFLRINKLLDSIKNRSSAFAACVSSYAFDTKSGEDRRSARGQRRSRARRNVRVSDRAQGLRQRLQRGQAQARRRGRCRTAQVDAERAVERVTTLLLRAVVAQHPELHVTRRRADQFHGLRVNEGRRRCHADSHGKTRQHEAGKQAEVAQGGHEGRL